MEFSKEYRTHLCANLITLFKYSEVNYEQVTHFFQGAVPTLAALTTILESEWHEPTGTPLAPSHADSSLKSQWLGKVDTFLEDCDWTTDLKLIPVANSLADDIDANTTNYAQPIGVEGIRSIIDDLVIAGFDHDVQGDATITWALTLWGDNDTKTPRAWYVLHRVGTAFDPDAEIVLWDNVIKASDPVVVVRQVYSPVL
jgi:hypothetical protein